MKLLAYTLLGEMHRYVNCHAANSKSYFRAKLCFHETLQLLCPRTICWTRVSLLNITGTRFDTEDPLNCPPLC